MLSSAITSDVELGTPLLGICSKKPRNIPWRLLYFYCHGTGLLGAILVSFVIFLCLGPAVILHPHERIFSNIFLRAEVDFFLNIGITLHNTFGTLILSFASVSSIAALGAVVWIRKVTARCILTVVGIICVIAFYLPIYVSGWVEMYHFMSGEASNLRWDKEPIYALVSLTIFLYAKIAAFFVSAIEDLKKHQSNDISVICEAA